MYCTSDSTVANKKNCCLGIKKHPEPKLWLRTNPGLNLQKVKPFCDYIYSNFVSATVPSAFTSQKTIEHRAAHRKAIEAVRAVQSNILQSTCNILHGGQRERLA